jgi:hypothetical protein
LIRKRYSLVILTRGTLVANIQKCLVLSGQDSILCCVGTGSFRHGCK